MQNTSCASGSRECRAGVEPVEGGEQFAIDMTLLGA